MNTIPTPKPLSPPGPVAGFARQRPADVSLLGPSVVSATRSRLALVSENTVTTDAPMCAHTRKGCDELATTPLTTQVVVAISDVRRVLFDRMQGVGTSMTDEYLLLLLDTTILLAERADIGRRAGDIVRDTCEITPWAERLATESRQAMDRITAMREAA